MNSQHKEILEEIRLKSGKPTKHTFLETYLGTKHPRFAISNPVMREIAKSWVRRHQDIATDDLIAIITSLIHAPSFNEKIMGGLLLDYTKSSRHTIPPSCFDEWLDHLEGWAEVDTLCTSKYLRSEIIEHWSKWRPYLKKISSSKSIVKRRASLVFLCFISGKNSDPDLASIALHNVDKVKHEREVLITKAISWLLRSMASMHKKSVLEYLEQNQLSLPAIAVRETRKKIETGRKNP